MYKKIEKNSVEHWISWTLTDYVRHSLQKRLNCLDRKMEHKLLELLMV